MGLCDDWRVRGLGLCTIHRLVPIPFEMDLCQEWKIARIGICSFGMLSSAMMLMLTMVNAICIIKACFRVESGRRGGYLPGGFILACFTNVMLVLIPYGYAVYDREHIQAQASVMIFISTHSVFWIVLLIYRVVTRNELETPWPLLGSELTVMMLAVVPVFFWYDWMALSRYTGTVSKRKVFFYILEVCSIAAIYFATVTSSTRRVVASSSVWSKMYEKMMSVLPYIWPKKSISLQMRVMVCLSLLVAGRFINVYLPLYSKWIVDDLTNHTGNVYTLITIACVLKFLQGNSVMGGFLYNLRNYLWIPIQQYTTREIQVELFEHLHNLSLRWHLSRKTGQVLRVMDRGTSSINGILNYVLFTILPMMADVIIAIVFFFTMFDWYFGVLVFVTLALYIAITILVTEWRTKFRRDMNERENVSRTIGVDSLLNYETVKYYNAEKLEVQRFADSIIWYQKAEWASSASLSLLNLCQNGTIAVALTIGSLMIAYLISLDYSTLTAGDYVLFTTYMLQLYSPLNFFGTVYRVIQQSFIDMENMFELLAEEVEVEDKSDAVALELRDGSIEFDNVVFGYTPDRTILHGVSFTVNKGETVALVGPSGAGKSTVIRLLFRLFDVGDGRILFDGQDVRDVQMTSLRKHIGIVPQDTVLFNETIRYNIRFGDPKATDSQVEEAARMAEIHDRILSLPQGYDTMVGERGLKLSGGEKQRVAIARTVLKQPQFVLLDEATSALDTATERSIQKCLYEMCETRTTVVVAHRLSTIVNANRILVFDQGRIVESGTHAELLDQKAIYYNMWQAQNVESNGSDGNMEDDESEA